MMQLVNHFVNTPIGESIAIKSRASIVNVVSAYDPPQDQSTASPVSVLMSEPLGIKVNNPKFAFQLPPDWTPKLEKRFARLAEDKALGKLSIKEKIEFEKLCSLRRRLKNPRKGEEVIAEYNQRMFTRRLLNALKGYVDFHIKTTNPSN